MKEKPIGFVARCQCGALIGVMDYERTDRKDAGKLLGQWLADGCTVDPLFTSPFTCTVEQCKCG